MASSGRIETDSGANSYLGIDLCAIANLILSCTIIVSMLKICSSYSYALNSTSRRNKCQNHLLTSSFIECLKGKKKSVLKIQSSVNTFYMSRGLSMSRLTPFFKSNCSQIILKNLKDSFQKQCIIFQWNKSWTPPTNLSRLTSICRDNESHLRQLNPNFIFQQAKLFLSPIRQTIWQQI